MAHTFDQGVPPMRSKSQSQHADSEEIPARLVTEDTHHRMPIKKIISLGVTMLAGIFIGVVSVDRGRAQEQQTSNVVVQKQKIKGFDAQINGNSQRMMDEGRNTFR